MTPSEQSYPGRGEALREGPVSGAIIRVEAYPVKMRRDIYVLFGKCSATMSIPSSETVPFSNLGSTTGALTTPPDTAQLASIILVASVTEASSDTTLPHPIVAPVRAWSPACERIVPRN